MFKLSFKIQKIYWRSENYAIVQGNKFETTNAVLKKKLGRTMQIKGYFNTIFEGDRFIGDVEICEDKNGELYLTSNKFFELVEPEKKETLAKFISKRVKGLSLAKSKIIVNEVGLDCIDKIIDNFTILLGISDLKISNAKAEKISNQLKYCRRYDEIAIFVQSAGLPLRLANELYEKYKDDTIEIVRDDPYQICYDGLIPFNSADKLANECKINYNQPLRIQTGFYAYLCYKRDTEGCTCVYKDEKVYKTKKNFYQEFNEYLNKNGAIKGTLLNEEIDAAIEQLILDKKVIQEIDTKKTYLYTAELNAVENSIANQINRINNSVFKFCERKDIDEYFSTYTGFSLDSKQKDAIYNALLHNISILTGGPGTGKTATTNILVQAIKYICLTKKKRQAKIVLLGPTGKAADRIRELTNEPASTIHRKLGLSPDKKSVDVVLDVDYVIIDESSMIDVYLMDQLLKAIPDTTRLVFVGDINQLPSVGPGKVLDDMIASNAIPTVTLSTIFRQSKNSTIVENAHHIINMEDTENGFKLNQGNFHFIEEHNSVNLKNQIAELLKILKKDGYTEKDIAILSPMKDRDGGTFELNELFQEEFNNNKIEEIFIEKKFKIGDRVIQMKNNYDLKVFNGFIGTILNIYEEDGKRFVVVDFDNQTSIVEYNEVQVQELELAYAITVHKSQGSEYPIVIMPIHKSQSLMLTSKILYTALTRAKKEFYCIGEEDAINKAIHEKNKNKRNYRLSRLASKIKKAMVVY